MVLLLLTLLTCQAQAADVNLMLAKADRYRLSESSARVLSLVKFYQNGKLDKTRQYEVFVRPNRESLVIFKSKVETGQKLLMLGDNYWLLMPKSRRPIRITPMQKLLGDASVGDIPTLNWSEHYQAKLSGSESLIKAGEKFTTHKLILKAKTKGASYHRIVLWLDQKNDFPLKADLYLRSGKLAKQAWFEAGTKEGHLEVVSMTLLDRIQPQKKTVIEYQKRTPYQLAAKYYNPAFLVRQTQVDFQ
jgi:hypothetical protein